VKVVGKTTKYYICPKCHIDVQPFAQQCRNGHTLQWGEIEISEVRTAELVNAWDTLQGDTDRFEITEKKVKDLIEAKKELLNIVIKIYNAVEPWSMSELADLITKYRSDNNGL